MSKFSREAYTKALKLLMPQGIIWGGANSVQYQILSALARMYELSDTDAIKIIEQGFPATAVMLLSEWESTLGLPDDCVKDIDQSISIRQNSVVSKLISIGGQSKSYFILIAKALGYDITIEEFRHARCGLSRCGDAINGDDWPFTWIVHAPETTINHAKCGSSYCGEPIRSWGNKQLECRLTKFIPAHTIVIFGYGS